MIIKGKDGKHTYYEKGKKPVVLKEVSHGTTGGIQSIRVMSIEEATKLGILNEPRIEEIEKADTLKLQSYDHTIGFTIKAP